MRIEIQHLPKSVAMSFLQNNIYKLVIGNEKFHPIIHRQMRFIVHFVATKTYLCFNAKHIYLLVRNGQYWPPGMQTGTKSTPFFLRFYPYQHKLENSPLVEWPLDKQLVWKWGWPSCIMHCCGYIGQIAVDRPAWSQIVPIPAGLEIGYCSYWSTYVCTLLCGKGWHQPSVFPLPLHILLFLLHHRRPPHLYVLPSWILSEHLSAGHRKKVLICVAATRDFLGKHCWYLTQKYTVFVMQIFFCLS